MKKIIAIIGLALLLVTGCKDTYKCEIDYKIIYPDTTFVRHYEFTGDNCAKYDINDNGLHGKTLYIYPRGTFAYDIARVPEKEDNIEVTNFKVYRIGIDTSE